MGNRRYTQEQIKWMSENVNNYKNYKEMANAFNKKFNENRTDQAMSNTLVKRLKIKKSFNSGQFSETLKKDELPLGTIRQSNNGVTYIKVKLVGNKRPKFSGYKEPYWVPLQKKIYQTRYGEIKNDEMIIFLDCNNQNFNIDNLFCINRKISLILANNGWYSKDPKITKTGIYYAKLLNEIKNIKNLKK